MSSPAFFAASSAAAIRPIEHSVAPVTVSNVVVWCSTIWAGMRSRATSATWGVSFASTTSTFVMMPLLTSMDTLMSPCIP